MANRRLKWVPAKPCGGVIYSLHAWHNEVKFSLAKFIVGGVEAFMLWKGDEWHGKFDVRLEALRHAETLI